MTHLEAWRACEEKKRRAAESATELTNAIDYISHWVKQRPTKRVLKALSALYIELADEIPPFKHELENHAQAALDAANEL